MQNEASQNKRELNQYLAQKNAREYIQQKMDLYGSLENMPDVVREVVEALQDKQ